MDTRGKRNGGHGGHGACSTPVTDGQTVAANAADAEAGRMAQGRAMVVSHPHSDA
jgi:hypothetical protein